MNSIKTVNVIGGGTSGWITAAMLASSFRKTGRDIKIRLIESPSVSTIGVGEGTFPTIVNTLHEIGLSEKEFLTECDAVFKQGAKFCNWLYDPAKKVHAYYHPFDPPAMPKGINLSAYWLRDKGKKYASSFAHAVTVQANLCDMNLPPKMLDTPEYDRVVRYAYHLDSGKLGALLKSHSIKNLSIEYISADIEQVNLDEDGFISEVVSNEGESFAADFFVDCSGFSSLLLGKALNVPFISKSEYLSVDTAVTLQVPYAEGDAISSHTIATAQESGWIWDIGLQTRRGTGYVYSSKHTTPERAEEVLREYHGIKGSDAPLRHISFDVGFREKFWVKNCAAIGLSSAFVEPLEATAIAMVEAGVRSLAANFPVDRTSMESRAKVYNKVFTHRWNDVIDFIKLHYCLTERDDTAFWREQRDESRIPESLKEKLEFWKHFGVSDGDFPNKYDMFTSASWQYVLYGLGFEHKYVECGILPEEIQDKAFESIKLMAENAKSKLPNNREFVAEYISK